ncbi:uncharacterized protein LOC100183247 [Ciona intestinalis]
MRIDRSVPEDKRTGVSVYYNDYKKRLSVDCARPIHNSAYRINRPHPPKNFLDPHPSISDQGLQFQTHLRKAVRRYVDDLYVKAEENPPDRSYNPQPAFSVNQSYRDSPDTPLTAGANYKKSPQFYPCNQTLNVSSYPLNIVGRSCSAQPTNSIKAERQPPLYLQGESKRDRSVRINEEIRENSKLKVTKPQKGSWQAPSSPLPNRLQPHWVSQSKPKNKRISSAPPGVNGYTHYIQQPKRNMQKHSDDMTSKMEKWASGASNYEKQVIYKMLAQVTPNNNHSPSTPCTFNQDGVDQFAEANVPSPEYDQPYEQYPSLTDYSKRKKRNVHSAPIKKMGGLVTSSTQHPPRDQRIYRLKGQDTRVDPSPEEERHLNGYMNQLQQSQYHQSKKDRKYARVPMHTYMPRYSTGAQDYQCKVSFFQSVRSPFKNHFVIHPDFTSETVKKRKPCSHTITHFRY